MEGNGWSVTIKAQIGYIEVVSTAIYSIKEVVESREDIALSW